MVRISSSVNSNLISLKLVIFLFFGALGSLYPFLPLHMNEIGLAKNEAVTITAVAALVATLGPLIVAPLSDRLAGTSSGGKRSKSGQYLRVMIVVCLICSVVFYWLLTAVPRIKRGPPKVSFMCDERRAVILQDRCNKEEGCYNFDSERIGKVLVKNCDYTCEISPSWQKQISPEPEPTPKKNKSNWQFVDSESVFGSESSTESVVTEDVENGTLNSQFLDNEANYVENDWNAPAGSEVLPADNVSSTSTPIFLGIEPIPHMCYKTGSPDAVTQVCEVYTSYSDHIEFELSLKPNINDFTNESIEYCIYPIAQEFSCRMPAEIVENLTAEYHDCKPVIGCEIKWPYNNTDSLLERSQCGYDNITFYLYVLIRSIADIFPTAALVLIDAAIVIATRETSTGRGDVGKQFAVGALGIAIFSPLVAYFGDGSYTVSIFTFTILMLLAAVILVFDSTMPLSPPEWWWHTRCGLLALPMSSVRKYGFEVVALGIVFFLLGIFWNAIDAFLPWHIIMLEKSSVYIIGLTYGVGAILAVELLTYAEKIVDYCGHSNILILCFVHYIVHHLALLLIEKAPFVLLCEVLETISLHFMWVTAVLYMRHLVPRKFTTCGQALPVIAHFCLGRYVGALLGGLAYSEYPDNFKSVHKWFAVAAAVAATVYFIAYHFYLKFYCIPPTQLPPDPAPSTIQHVNGNGNYTPLRVYHNSSAKKGHFRY